MRSLPVTPNRFSALATRLARLAIRPQLLRCSGPSTERDTISVPAW